MNYYTKEVIGLGSAEALKILHSDLEQELSYCKCASHTRSGICVWLGDSFFHSSVSSTFRWPSILLTVLTLIVFLISYVYSGELSLLFQSFILLFFLVFNVLLTAWDTWLRHQELHNKCRLLSETIKNCSEKSQLVNEWKTGKYYPNLYLPQSPCITLQWTYRDNQKVNLPTSLLVKGDIILICPGRAAPGHCKSLEQIITSFDGETSTYLELKQGDRFGSTVEQGPMSFTSARLRKAAKPVKFIMLETPYISGLRLALNQASHRPATLYEKERHTIITKYIERIIIPLVWLVVFTVSIIHYGYISSETKVNVFVKSFYVLLLRPTSCLLPLLPLTLPSLWLIVNAFGVAHLFNLIKSRPLVKESANVNNFSLGSPGSYLGREDATVLGNINTNNSSIPTAGSGDGSSVDDAENGGGGDISDKSTKLKRPSSDPFFDDLESNSSLDIVPIKITWNELCKSVLDLLTCKDGNLWRSANILQVFGSITALCCVDKKGILSWPNPSADKVFFLSSNCAGSKHGASQPDYLIEDADDEIFVDEVTYRNSKNNESIKMDNTCSAKVKKDKYFSKSEVLDITHDIHNSFGLQFDDPEWPRFLPNLKPLGLAILLNTCNMDAQEEYNLFCDHITCESLRNEASVPVVNKRCLCELSRLMGFTEKAITDYRYMFQISSFRHVKPEVIQEGKLAKSLNFPRLKMPFPNMTSAVIRDICTGSYQLFSQGNGDFILDACTEFWDGQDLCTLTEPDRKRILDFYHRSSLAAYCMAFSYVPLNTYPDRRLNNDFFIELPPDSRHVFQSQKNLNSSVRAWETREGTCARPLMSHHLSTDSLTTKEGNKIDPTTTVATNPTNTTSTSTSSPTATAAADTQSSNTRSKSTSSTSSVDGYHFETLLNQLTNQVFIGMVTMQYQACPDFVALVELLDKACIRFVHFSKENELRSRVFSEKMGLEAGWNCHISLLSETASKETNLNVSQSHMNSFKSSKASIHPNVEANATLVRTQSAPSYFNTDPTAVKFEKSPLREQASSILITTEDCDGIAYIDETPKENDNIMISVVIDGDKNEGENFDTGRTTKSINDTTDEEQLNPTSSRSHNMGGKESFNLIESDNEDCRSKSWSEVSTSPSHVTESTNTDRSAPITFDVNNRAKLPKGIEQIRPHLAEVDNVPLLVSLFTDCTPQTTREMIEIMQENGEVVCVIGSAANVNNIPIFLQTDASIGIEPLYPQICVKEPVTKSNGKPYKGFISPTDISNALNTLPCSISFHREDSISLNQIIMQARHYMMNARNCLQFFFSCSLSLSLAQLFATLFFLPPLLSPGSVLWLVTIVFPLLSLSLMGTPLDTQVMNQATGKNLNLSRESIIYFLMCYLIKFCPSTMIIVASFALIINNSCKQIVEDETNSSGPCWMLIDDNVTYTEISKWNDQVLMAQTFSVACIVIYFIIISIGFVHRSHLLWRRSPFANRCWAIMSIILFILNLIFCFAQLHLSYESPIFLNEFATVPPYIFILAFLWPLILIVINSLVKGHEIKISERQQRRARLEFGTKLGMNSPF